MLIIVEGPDGAGKTTFVRALGAAIARHSAHESITTLHARPPKSHPLDEYETPLFAYRPGIASTYICDRWHWGERIYPNVLGRSTQYDLAVRRHVELFLQKKGAVVAYLSATPNTLRQRIRERGDDMISPLQVDEIYYEYAVVASRSILPVERVFNSWTDADVDRVVRTAKTAETLASSLDPFVTYVGPRTPRVLLLGDVRHPLRNGRRPLNFDERAPAFGPYPGTSGHFLLSHVKTVRRVGFANACDMDDWRVLHAVLGRPRIVTLGTNASKSVGSISHGAVSHPQFVRRFHHREGALYGSLISRAIEEDGDFSWKATAR